MNSPAQDVAYISRMVFERGLTDLAGGNVSAREGNAIYSTPRYAGSRRHWNLAPQDIIVGPLDSDELLENPSFSREGISHLTIYRAFPEVKGIIHAHPPDILPFCSLQKPIEPILDAARKFGTIEFIEAAPPYSQEQANNLVARLRGKEDLMRSAAAAVLMPRHGIFVAGKDLYAAIDALERINTNARCIVVARILS